MKAFLITILSLSFTLTAIGQKKVSDERLEGLSSSYYFNSTQTKELLIGNWGDLILTKDSVFIISRKEHFKYQLDSNVNDLPCKHQPNCYYLVALEGSGNHWFLGLIDSISNNYLRLYSYGSDNVLTEIYTK